MPDILPWWLDQSLPPTAFGEEPTTAPWTSPGAGGPGSYPAATPYPTPNLINTINAGPGLTFVPGGYPITDPSGSGLPTDTLGLPEDPYAELPPPPNTVNAGPGLEFVPDPNTGALPPPPGSRPPGTTPPSAPPPPMQNPAWTRNPPGSGPLSPRDRYNMGQDVDPNSGYGDPGNYNPYGPGGPPGTLGIVSPNSPAGGGSFFGGHSNNPFGIPGSSFMLGASGGTLAPGMANLYLHSSTMQKWAQNQGYRSIGDWMSHTGFSLAGGWPTNTKGEVSGAGLSGAGRPMSTSR